MRSEGAEKPTQPRCREPSSHPCSTLQAEIFPFLPSFVQGPYLRSQHLLPVSLLTLDHPYLCYIRGLCSPSRRRELSLTLEDFVTLLPGPPFPSRAPRPAQTSVEGTLVAADPTALQGWLCRPLLTSPWCAPHPLCAWSTSHPLLSALNSIDFGRFLGDQ